MILAAGRGERMRPLTDHTPKPLMMAGGEPLIGWHIRRLAACGVTDLVINHAWLGERLETAIGAGEAYGVNIAWSREAEALETAGGIAQALPLLGEGPFVVVSSDVLTDLDFAPLMRETALLDGKKRMIHLILVDNPPHHPGGDFVLCEDGRVSADPEAAGQRLTYAGIGGYHPALFAELACQSPVRHPLRPLLVDAMTRGQVTGVHFKGTWLDVGTAERLDEANRIAHQWESA